jgi:hypothetical protein
MMKIAVPEVENPRQEKASVFQTRMPSNPNRCARNTEPKSLRDFVRRMLAFSGRVLL